MQSKCTGYKAVAFEGQRVHASVNDKLLVFNTHDVKFLGPVQESFTARHILRAVPA